MTKSDENQLKKNYIANDIVFKLENAIKAIRRSQSDTSERHLEDTLKEIQDMQELSDSLYEKALSIPYYHSHFAR